MSCFVAVSWWRHQMETFSALLAICAGNLPVPGEFPAQRPVTRSCDVFFDLRLNKRLSKQSWGWWFETLSRSLWRHRNIVGRFYLCLPSGLPRITSLAQSKRAHMAIMQTRRIWWNKSHSSAKTSNKSKIKLNTWRMWLFCGICCDWPPHVISRLGLIEAKCLWI